ncbi:SspB family protein [Phreatobacter sp.]|uniref:SspB family protein n=1 Tax=Phreatobacter sp. TaxID=1966341 RepID=UPI003F6F22B7
MPTDLIRYDILAQEALRGVVRRVLVDVVRDGLPGDHHFYITFDTRAPGVRLSNRMREKYPEDMTIVLQHQFWDLIVTEHTFEVGLAFGGIPERLLVPFDAVKGFFDPSVQFGLQFEVASAEAAGTEAAGETEAAPPVAPLPRPRPAEVQGEPRPDEARKPTAVPSVPSEPAPAGGAEVVSLDKFRKK